MRSLPSRLSSLMLALLLVVAPLAGALLARAQGPEEPFPTTLEQIQSVTLPVRDPVALGQRLRGVTDIPAPPAKPAYRWQVGDTATFWADNLETDDKFQVDATLEIVTDAAYIWVQSDIVLDEADLRSSAETFTRVTYPQVRAAFGSEANPGIDGDPRLHILHTTGLGAGTAAYFGAESLYPQVISPGSNEREMFFVNLDTMASAVGSSYYDGVLAHEFQHMIHWANDANEDSWLDEGMAELASLLAGFDDTGFAPQFLRSPGIQLNTWPEIESTIPHYGAAFLFATYFHERFGDDGTRLLVTNTANGLGSVDDTLRALNAIDPLTGQPLTSADIFADWTAANLLNDRSIADGRFGYTLVSPALGSAAVQTEVTTYPTTLNLAASQYSASYITLKHTGQGRIQLDFTGAESVPLVSAQPFSGQRMWYSNRGDMTDSYLTRAFDLTGVQQATLEFETWYDIEALWDYAYVMVSTDGGSTWTPLASGRTTTEDPHGNAYGPAYTGDSVDSIAASPQWVHEKISLTPYAGQEILLRFELITDEAVNTPGMLIDDVRISEIGFFDDMEAGMNGWRADGWLYIDNTLPQQWIVQVATRGPQPDVTRLLMPGEGSSGSWELDLGGLAGDATLIISPVAPLTTERGSFALTVERVE